MAIESALCSPLSPDYLITAKLPSGVNTHPIITHLQCVWRRVALAHKVSPYLHSQAGLWLNPKLCIGKAPFLWELWFQKGIRVLDDLYNEGTLRSFDNLKQQFNIPQNQFWRYLQLRHLLMQTFGSTSTPPPKADIWHQLVTISKKGHAASAYYSILLLINVHEKMAPLRRSWETDLNVSITEEAWTVILNNSKRMSRELKTRLIQFKILNRVYWTPSRLHRVGLRDNAGCWRCSETHGSLLHMLWSCPQVKAFWLSVHDHINRIVGQNIPFTPDLFILGDSGALESLTPPHAEWIQTALMLGRKLIVMNWKASSAPTAVLWFIQLGKVAALENLSFRLLNKVDLYMRKWEKYHAYMDRGQ